MVLATLLLDDEKLAEVQIIRAPGVISAELDDEAVLMNTFTGTYISLNKVGASIWRLLEEQCTFPKLIRSLMQEYEVEEELCKNETFAYLKKLTEAKLITAE